eukprot:4581014-Alexandrium_andersonii.AAC.1
MLGLSADRARWLAEWCGDVAKRGTIPVSELLSGLGRKASPPWSFVGRRLCWARSTLGQLRAGGTAGPRSRCPGL